MFKSVHDVQLQKWTGCWFHCFFCWQFESFDKKKPSVKRKSPSTSSDESAFRHFKRAYEEDEEAFKFTKKKREELKYLGYDKPDKVPT